MSLVVIALAGLVLAGLARRSLTLASQSSDAQEELQRRWGTISLQRAVLQRAEAIVAHNTSQSAAPLAREPYVPVTTQLQLGTITFEVVLADENTEVNLNRIQSVGGKGFLDTVLMEILVSSHGVRLRPRPADERRFDMRPYDSWGQVFSLESLPQAEHAPSWVAERTKMITCWGNGRINAHRASDAVLQTVLRRVAGPSAAEQLIRLRLKHPDLNVNEWIDRMSIDRLKRARLRNWITDESSCYSLWIRADNGQRRWCNFAVAESGRNGVFRVSHFAW